MELPGFWCLHWKWKFCRVACIIVPPRCIVLGKNSSYLRHISQITSHFLLSYLSAIGLCKSVSRRRRRLLKGPLRVWKVNAILIHRCHFYFFPWRTLFWPLILCDVLRGGGDPYTYFNNNINSCAISLRGKKMSFCSFVIENHNKIYGSVNCTESHERFIFIHHASSQRTLRTFPKYDSLMPTKGSTMCSATS